VPTKERIHLTAAGVANSGGTRSISELL